MLQAHVGEYDNQPTAAATCTERYLEKDTRGLKCLLDKVKENFSRVEGVEDGISRFDKKLDRISQTNKLHTSRLQEMKQRIDHQNNTIKGIESDLEQLKEARLNVNDGRTSEARPENEGVDQVTSKHEEGVSTAQNQSSNSWPGSMALPQTIPTLDRDFTATMARKPVAAQTKVKSELVAPWSSSVLETCIMVLSFAVMHLEPIVTIVTLRRGLPLLSSR